jgi:hypothetical protein
MSSDWRQPCDVTLAILGREIVRRRRQRTGLVPAEGREVAAALNIHAGVRVRVRSRGRGRQLW